MNGTSEAYLPVYHLFFYYYFASAAAFAEIALNKWKYEWLVFIVEIITFLFFMNNLYNWFLSSFSKIFSCMLYVYFYEIRVWTIPNICSFKTSFLQWITTNTKNSIILIYRCLHMFIMNFVGWSFFSLFTSKWITIVFCFFSYCCDQLLLWLNELIWFITCATRYCSSILELICCFFFNFGFQRNTSELIELKVVIY